MDQPQTSTKVDEDNEVNSEKKNESSPQRFSKAIEILKSLRNILPAKNLMFNVLMVFMPRPGNGWLYNLGLIIVILAFW